MNIISRLLGGRGYKRNVTRTNTFTNPLRISNPVAGFVCVEPELQRLMEADRTILGFFFSQVHTSSDEVVPCHVLFLYCKVEKDGSLAGSKVRIRDFIKASGAYVAIVASENDGSHYIQSLQPKNNWSANIVLIINRRGTAFTVFFQKLFEAMKGGTSMPMAWVKLSPQGPLSNQLIRDAHQECPNAIMIAEAGHITLDGRG